MNIVRIAGLLAASALLLWGCKPTAPSPDRGTSPLPEPGASPLAPLSRPPLNPEAAAVACLAGQLDIPPEAVRVVSSAAVQWPDTSLGCPQPGMVYAQVITPGYRFVLEAGEARYEVHTDETGQMVVACP